MTRDASPPTEEIRSAEKEKTLKLIEQKLKSYEEKKELEEASHPQAVKKKQGHFWSDCKVGGSKVHRPIKPFNLLSRQVYFSLIILVLLAAGAVVFKVSLTKPF